MLWEKCCDFVTFLKLVFCLFNRAFNLKEFAIDFPLGLSYLDLGFVPDCRNQICNCITYKVDFPLLLVCLTWQIVDYQETLNSKKKKKGKNLSMNCLKDQYFFSLNKLPSK